MIRPTSLYTTEHGTESTVAEDERGTGGARERILETAARLFYEQGYRATGVNQIVEEAGVAKASFYHHFASKEALAEAWLEARHRSWMSDFRSAVDAHEQPERRLAAVFEFLERWAEEPGYRGCAFLNMTSEFPDGRTAVRRRAREHKSSLRRYLGRLEADLRAEGGVSAGGESTDALYLLAEAAMVESQNFESTWPIVRAHETAKQLLGG